MTIALGSAFGDFQAYFEYTTSSTATSYSVKVTNAGMKQNCTWSEYPWKTTMTATSHSSREGTDGTARLGKGYHSILEADKTYSWTRKTSAYTVTIKATTKKNISGGSSGSVSKSFTVPALAKYTVSYNANGGTGAPSAQTKYYGINITVPSTKPTRSGYTFMGWSVPGRDKNEPYYQPGGTIEYNGNQTLVAYWSKTITLSYNANGGSGVPSSQSATVYNATTSNTFTIPSTVPTRAGYLFLGWSTSASATSASYSAGDKITLSANGTLYAVWRLNVFTVTYDANGGSGAPQSQTKTYGTDLVLSSNVPTRQYYTFKGWATSASGSVVYSAGGTYTTNANITLYAVWEVAYIIPRITSVAVARCDENMDAQDDGTYAVVNFKWATDEPVSGIKIYWKASTDSTYSNSISVTATGNSGSVRQRIGDGNLSEDNVYNIKIDVIDTTDFNTVTKTLGATTFPIDLLEGGKGVSIGEPAKEEGFIVKLLSKFKSSVQLLNGQYLYSYNAGDAQPRPMVGMNGSNQYFFGYGSYANKEGAVFFDGNVVNIRSNGNININGSKLDDFVVEQGSSNNTYWRKWASGRMEQWLNVTTTSQAINSAYGSLYVGNYTWTFPVAFTNCLGTYCGTFKWGTSASWGASTGSATTNVVLRGYDVVSRAAGTATYIQAYAYGSWK